jgi:hypothetical protein
VADPTAPPEPRALPFEALSVVELEALAVAGKTVDVFPGVTPGALPDPLDPIDLTPFAGSSPGRAAVFRTVDLAPPKQEYTTVDWLDETIQGARYQQELPPPVEFGDLAGGHALTEPLGWAAFRTGGSLRAGLDALHAATVGGRRLDDAIVDWWVAKVDIGAGGRWPVALPGAGGPPDLPAGPQRPFVDAATRPVGTASGLDAFDLAAVQAARALVRDGRDETAQVELPLFLAVMDREGYRTNGGQDRVGNFGDQGFRDHPLKIVDQVTGLPRSIRRDDFPAAVTGLGQAFLDNFARVGWIVFPYGLDIFNQGVNAGSFVASVASSFTDRLTFLRQERVLAASVDPAWAHAFALDRLRGRAFGVDAVLQNQRRSRRLQWLGILCQQAEFQQRHKALSNAFQLGSPFDEVDELVSGVRPQPGPDANSPQRKAYLAYWALVYLAFNVLPSTWNAWVQEAEAARDKVAGETVSAFLLYHTNTDPLAVEPPRPPPGPDPRHLFQRANMLRFAVALDAYLRVDPGGAHDTSDPAARAW